MPAVLACQQFAQWLDPDSHVDDLKAMLAPYGGNDLEVRPVDKRVGNVRNNDPQLIAQ